MFDRLAWTGPKNFIDQCVSLTQVYVRMVYGNFINRRKYQSTATLDGGKFSGVPWVSALIEGRGRFHDPNTGKK